MSKVTLNEPDIIETPSKKWEKWLIGDDVESVLKDTDNEGWVLETLLNYRTDIID